MGVAKRAVGYIRVSDNPQADLDGRLFQALSKLRRIRS